uniref:Cytohesin Ubiquitin Protein Inducing domain-containing protein n=1 Tax=Oryzias latipes TaxID=8090 RepID=A0A3P9MQJ8_ORYLA
MDFTEISAQPTNRLSSVGSKDPVILTSNASPISTGSADSEVSDKKRKEKIAELKKKGKDLQQMLNQKIEELKRICLREAELTGKLPKEYPLDTDDEKVPQVPRCIRDPFRLNDPPPWDKDPVFRESDKQFLSEGALYKTVKSKRRDDYMNAVKNQEESEKPINGQKIAKARKATKGVSLVPTDDVHSSAFSSPSHSLSLDDDYDPGSQREQFGTVQYSTVLHHAKTLHIPQIKDRQPPGNDHLTNSRLNQSNYKSLHYCQTDAKSSCSTRSRPTSRRPEDSNVMSPNPLLSYSNVQLRLENNPQSFRQCSGSLESLSQIMTETKNTTPSFAILPAQRSSSTEALDDVSSYTSQSSVEYNAPASSTHRRGHRKDHYRNTGSMPNLVESEPSCYRYHPPTQCSTAYYVAGYPKYGNIEPHLPYGGESERYYDFYPPYHLPQGPHYRVNMYSHYASNDMDNVSYNPYASVGPAGNRFTAQSAMQHSKSIQKAVVAEHLKGWFQRNTTQRQGTHNYDYDGVYKQMRKSQNSAVFYTYNNKNIPSSTAVSFASSNENWNTYRSDGPSLDEPDSYLYSAASNSLSNHSRSYIDASHSSHMHNTTTQGDQICWHEDSEPGTIV